MRIEKEKKKKINKNKFNLKSLNSKYEKYIDCFRYKIWLKKDITFSKNIYKKMLISGSYIDNRRYQLITLSWKYLKQNITSLLSPAFNFNRLIESYLEYLKKSDIQCPMSNVEFVEYFCSIHTCLISLKTGLDRIAQLFPYYYRGISKYITFGHANEKGKYTNFLSFVNQKINSAKEDKILFKTIIDNYNNWIKQCVSPRDQIMHYDDMLVIFGYNEEYGMPEPIGRSKKAQIINIELIKKFTFKFYALIDMIFDYFLFKSKLISPCDLNGLYLSPEKVEKYLNDLEYNPYNDSSLKSVFNSEPNN